MRYRYYLCDTFTDTRFGGNQLAILPEAQGLSDEQMQKIAREFNLTQTTFVFPPERGHTRKVRIFTTSTEVPFAGRPNIGTAFVLATVGEFGQEAERRRSALVAGGHAGALPRQGRLIAAGRTGPGPAALNGFRRSRWRSS